MAMEKRSRSDGIPKTKEKQNGRHFTKPDRSLTGSIRLLLSVVSALYFVILFLFLPLVYHDKYYDIGVFKYDFFFYTTVPAVLLTAVLLIILITIRLAKRDTDPVKLIEQLSRITNIDKAVLAYMLVCIISYFMSPYHTGAVGYKGTINPPLLGAPGWRMGLISQLLFCCIYFMAAKLTEPSFRRIIMAAVYTGSLIAYLLALLNRFSIDPLGFYRNITPYYKLIFLSTLGQSTWYSSFLSTLLPVALAMFIYEKRSRYRAFYTFYIVIGSMSLVTQNSDSAYIALFAALLTLFVFALDRNNYFARFLQLILIILLSFRLVGLLQFVFPEAAVMPESISRFFSQSVAMLVITILYALLYVVFSLVSASYGIFMRRIRIIRTLLLVICGVMTAFVTAVLVLSRNEIYVFGRDASPYLIFNDSWGSGRGFTWRMTVQMFRDFPLTAKLFGIGPDCYAEYAYEYHSAEMMEKWGGEVLPNAHNEWFNTLFNLGILGLISYVAVFFSAFRDFIMKKHISAISMAGAAAIAAYVCHNFFCYQQILCTPFIFAIMGLCKALE
ncbi:MAG: O-antigen ligase family protein [Lachnospiraceae bacterium]|nr:O-antigen ligase family protein [Lachnospiraceae bacterium]